MAKFNLQPDEAIILQETSVEHGFGLTSAYTDELYLTTRNIYCINKGVFGNTKNIFCYPLNQVKRANDRPQVILGKKSNGTPSLDIYFMNSHESFSFQSGNKSKIKKWIQEIYKALGFVDDGTEEFDDSDTPIGELKSAFNDAMSDLGINFQFGKKKATTNQTQANTKVTKRCISCSAPLVGIKGQTIRCKYCDTDQTL